jgi:hypothetical protein
MNKWWWHPAAATGAYAWKDNLQQGRFYTKEHLQLILERHGVNSESQFGAAKKYLRHELGIDLVCPPHRHNTIYWIEPTVGESEYDARCRMKRMYSESVTSYRTKAGQVSRQVKFALATVARALAEECGIAEDQVERDLGIRS